MPEHAAAARSLLRETAVDAVDDVVRSSGWSATTMADVARAAEVSRQTLYNEFGSRAALVEAYVTREIDSLVSEVEATVRAYADDPHRALRSAVEHVLKLASDEPVVRLVTAAPDPGTAAVGEMIGLLTGVGLRVAAPRIAALVVEVWPAVSVDDARLVAETVVRLVISHALVPTLDPGVAAAGIGCMLAPFVDGIAGGTGSWYFRGATAAPDDRPAG